MLICGSGGEYLFCIYLVYACELVHDLPLSQNLISLIGGLYRVVAPGIMIFMEKPMIPSTRCRLM